jgi:hypothetical protein
MATLSLSPSPGAGYWPRLAARLRGWLSRRLLLRLAGVDAVVLAGRTYAIRAVPLGQARRLVPAIIRCSQRFCAGQIDEGLYDDLVIVLAVGLDADPAAIERLDISLWALAPVLERIARANDLPMLEADQAGKAMATLLNSTGTNSIRSSSAPPAGPGITSTLH